MKKYKAIIYVFFLFFILLGFEGCSRHNVVLPNENTNYNEPRNEKVGYEFQNNQDKVPIIVTTPPTVIIKEQPAPTHTNKVISTFSTRLLDTHKNRIYNLKLASSKINNYIVYPGTTFSFNKVVGKRDPAHGYKKARILIDGEKDEDIGGGICQLSSTLYNSVKKLNFIIVERHTHSGDVHYIPLGYDAAVNYSSMDFKFINIKSYPIKLTVSLKEGYLTVNVVKFK